MLIYRIVLGIYFILWCTPAFSQHYNLKFRRISTESGLSQSNVICILQDKKGFMWFGTRYGLNKYDGYGFTAYKKNDKANSISSNTIMHLMEDSNGNIWIATWGGGVSVFDPRKEEFTNYQSSPGNREGLSDNFINVIYEDRNGNIWIGTNSGGLNLFNPEDKTFQKFTFDKKNPKSIGSNSVQALLEDKHNNLWVGTDNGGLNLLNRRTLEFEKFLFNPNDPTSISFNSVRNIHEDEKGNLWIGTYGGGLNLFEVSKGQFKRFLKEEGNPNSLPHNTIFALAEDDEGRIWVGTENGGLSILDPENFTFSNYQHSETDEQSISNNSVYSIYKDIKGNIWVGTFSGGINLYSTDSRKFNHYRSGSAANSLSNNSVLCFFEGSAGNVWIGTDGGGLDSFDPKAKSFTHYRHNEKDHQSINGDHVLSVLEDSEGNLWVGTWGGGVTRYNRKENKYVHFRHDPADSTTLGSNNAWVIFEDRDKDIWVGTFYGGLNKYDKANSNFTRYQNKQNDPNSISSNNIYNIFQDKKGQFWIGTSSGGLNLFDKQTGKFIRFLSSDDPNTISNNMVSSIFEDSEGILWIGTDGGLNRFDPGARKFEVLTEEDGLPNEMVFGILEDGQKNFWLSTNNGLSKFNPGTRKIINFTMADGLQHDEFKRRAFLKAKDGTMYFGGINGFNEFHPEDINKFPYDPPLVITDFQIFNKRIPVGETDISEFSLSNHISYTDKLYISYKASVISFEFASLNYTAEEKKQYAYMLEGFDKNWNEIGVNRVASYTNLNPGNYIFKVKGLDNEGEWSENVTTLPIYIAPPYWKTTWFKLLIISALIGCAYSAFILRVNSIKRQKKLLEAQVTERTNAVTLQKEKILAQSEMLEVLYNEIKDSIRAAQNIQQAIIPSSNYIKKYLPDSFVLNKPKDVVSGDFYWFNEVRGQIVLAVADCTGHGVSGALMAINGHHLLNQCIYGSKELTASDVLNKLNKSFARELNQKYKVPEVRDGMDIGLCIIDKDKSKLQYAGGNAPLYIVRNNELHQIKANRFSVGLHVKGKVFEFDNNEVALFKGDMLYMFTDGYADQIGGEGGESKYLYQRFRNILMEIHKMDMDAQLKILEDEFDKWKGAQEQLDDVLIIGLRV